MKIRHILKTTECHWCSTQREIYSNYLLRQELANIFYKGPNGKYFRLCKQYSLVLVFSVLLLTKYLRLGHLQRTDIYFLQFWRLGSPRPNEGPPLMRALITSSHGRRQKSKTAQARGSKTEAEHIYDKFTLKITNILPQHDINPFVRIQLL